MSFRAKEFYSQNVALSCYDNLTILTICPKRKREYETNIFIEYHVSGGILNYVLCILFNILFIA